MAAPQDTAVQEAGRRSPHGVVLAYRWALTLLLADVVLQFFLAGLGAFGGGFDGHVLNSIVVLALALAVFVLALLARVGRRDVLLALAVLLLVGVVQSLFRVLADDTGPFWGGLHAVGGLAILGITGFLQGEAVRRSRAVEAR